MRKVSDRICSVEGCGRKHYAFGLCPRHYHRKRNAARRPPPPPLRDLMGEEWRPVVDFPDYEVSNLGRVRSREREILTTAGHFQRVHARELKPNRSFGAYEIVALRKDRRQHLKCIHHLVAEAFIGPRPDGYFANHLDGDKYNNRVTNLEWTTPAGNNKHARDTGLHRVPIGEEHGLSKLTDEAVRHMRRVCRPGSSTHGVEALAKQYGISRSTARKAIRGEKWKHLNASTPPLRHESWANRTAKSRES